MEFFEDFQLGIPHIARNFILTSIVRFSFHSLVIYLMVFYNCFQTAILTLILVPVRVGLICFFVVTGWMLATVGLFGVTEQELHEKPLEGWRK